MQLSPIVFITFKPSSASYHAKDAHCSLKTETGWECFRCFFLGVFFQCETSLQTPISSPGSEARFGVNVQDDFFLLSCLGSNCSAACPSPKQADTETFKWLPFFSLGTHLTHDTSVSFTPGSSRPHYIFLSGRLCGYCAPRPHPFHLLPTRACKKKKNQGSG